MPKEYFIEVTKDTANHILDNMIGMYKDGFRGAEYVVDSVNLLMIAGYDKNSALDVASRKIQRLGVNKKSFETHTNNSIIVTQNGGFLMDSFESIDEYTNLATEVVDKLKQRNSGFLNFLNI